IRPCSNSNPRLVALATDCNTRTASTVTSCPMPSPGRTAIRNVVIASFLRPDFLGSLRGRVDHAIQRAEIRTSAGLDDVGGRSLARDDRPVEVDLYRHFADRVLARGGGPNRVITKLALEPGDGVDGVEHGVDRPVSNARVLEDLVVLAQPDGGR